MSDEEKRVAILHDGVEVLKFYADWCGPCKAFAPIFDEVKNDPQFSDITFHEVDVDKETELAEEYQVRSIPAVVFLVYGDSVNRKASMTKEELIEAIEEARKAL